MTLKRYIRSKYTALVFTMVVQSKPLPDDNYLTYGHQIDDIVNGMLSPLSVNAVGYKIEDDGMLVGCYVIDFDPTSKDPYVAILLIRDVYTQSEKDLITAQVSTWLQAEYPLPV